MIFTPIFEMANNVSTAVSEEKRINYFSRDSYRLIIDPSASLADLITEAPLKCYYD